GAVGDVMHLLADVVQTATTLSRPGTTVVGGGQLVGGGFAVGIEDGGLGMSDEEMAAANEQMARPPEFNLSSTGRLGLYVVGRLAERHGVRVTLRGSPYGGTTAIVLLPVILVVPPRNELTADEGSGRPVGRHAVLVAAGAPEPVPSAPEPAVGPPEPAV